MPQACSICSHPEREAIEKALIDRISLRDIARQFEVSKDAVARHRWKCIKQDLAEVGAERDKHFVWNVLAEMQWLHEEVRSVYKEARDGKDHKASLQALGEVRQQTKLFSELLQGMEPGQAERLEQEWIAVREAIFNALEPYPEARLAVAEALYALGKSYDHESRRQLLQAPAPDNAS